MDEVEFITGRIISYYPLDFLMKLFKWKVTIPCSSYTLKLDEKQLMNSLQTVMLRWEPRLVG